MMGVERESESVSPSSSQEEVVIESLTDLMDRMDREAFRRALEHRELRLLGTHTRHTNSRREP
jgi:hypothetical protein